jgi:hypothetical protein
MISFRPAKRTLKALEVCVLGPRVLEPRAMIAV